MDSSAVQVAFRRVETCFFEGKQTFCEDLGSDSSPLHSLQYQLVRLGSYVALYDITSLKVNQTEALSQFVAAKVLLVLMIIAKRV